MGDNRPTTPTMPPSFTAPADGTPSEQKNKTIKEILKRPTVTYKTAAKDEEKIFERISNRRYELENDAFEQDIKLKKATLERLFIFLGAETIVIFVFALMQGIRLGGFRLEEWSFKLLVAATITQITTMLLVAVKHLFPQKK